MDIYTRRGDEGKTDLFSGERVQKTDSRIEAYGTADELNAKLGVVIDKLSSRTNQLADDLIRIQNHLHSICANLANTEPADDAPAITETQIDWLEERIDDMDDEIPTLTSFILPGGVNGGAQLHLARTVCRRAERRTIHAANDARISEEIIAYLNRLSDFLFVAGRYVNHTHNYDETPPEYE